MSRSTLYTFDKEGQRHEYKEYGNSWLGSIMVWQTFGEKYNLVTKEDHLFVDGIVEKICKITYDPLIPLEDRITMASTFDRTSVESKDFARLIWAFRESSKSLPDHCHIKKMADDIEKLIGDENVIAIGWQGTSVAENLWWIYGENEEEGRPYNYLKDDKHWNLFDEVK